MDEQWRAAPGVRATSRRGSADYLHRIPVDSPLDPDDFHDVFGGPPRTVLLRRFSGDQLLHRKRSLYDDAFRQPMRVSSGGTGRSLPGFRIPMRDVWVRTEEGFYDDIFGSNGGDRILRSRSKSKLGSSSSDRSTAVVTADASLVSLASKLRPITIPPRRQDCSAPSTICTEEPNNSLRSSSRRLATPSGSMDLEFNSSNGFKNPIRHRSHTAFLCCFSPPKTASYHRYDRSSEEHNRIFDSPSSVIPSFFLDPIAKQNTTCLDIWKRSENETENGRNLVESEGAEVTDNSFLIEINDNGVQDINEDDAALDEAIAWARESFWNQKSAKSAATE